ncbi:MULTISPECIES: hypothetical protein [unclassified Yoonia]|uniref:hypothetical protein n=1 Tax=unclassified Yoonia TaxID=2629118 RepID=UPI002AFE899C|nr:MULTISPECIES: hypothetical protein [unclassified Yoonia]
MPSTDESSGVLTPVADVVPPEFHAKPAAAVEPIQPTPRVEAVESVPKPETSQPAEQPKPAPQSRNSFVPLLLGGVVAGAIGFAVATLTNPAGQGDLDALLAAQDARIETLQQDIAAIETVDLAPVTAAQDELAAQLTSLQDDVTALRIDLEDRIAAIEAAPRGGADGQMPDTAVFEAEIDALRAQLTEMTDIAQTELDAARAEAAAIEENAAAAARNAAARSALARLQTSVETGAPLGAALNDLEDVLANPAPDALLAAQDGVPTLSALQESFPDYARAALTTARAEGVAGEETSGIGAFLRNQFDVRSVNARDGDTADAILSRAQTALRNGQLAETLTEINALPDVARAEMSDWLALAERRADAIAAIDTLAASLRDN